MALAFNPLSWWLWSGKHQEPKISKGTSVNSSPDSSLLELDTLKFTLDRRRNMASSSRKVKRKWESREERKVDREYDIVLVPSDGGCVSGSESDDSDWSVGWLEPHGPGFQSDDDRDDSFAVLVPCYGRGRADLEDNAQDKFMQTIGNFRDIHASGNEKFMEQWLSSLRKKNKKTVEMGICTSSPLMTKQNGSIMNLPVTKVAMVIQMNGKLQEFRQPITAGDILIQNPDFFLCSSEAMNVDSLVPQLAKDEILQLGQLYFLLPVSKLQTPLSLQDMCLLAVKASTALNDYCNLSNIVTRKFKKMHDCHIKNLNLRPQVYESPLPLQ